MPARRFAVSAFVACAWAIACVQGRGPTGCTPGAESKERSGGTVTPEPPDRGSKTGFEKGTPIWRLYRELKENGVEDSALDRGFPRTDYANRSRSVFHARDGKIQSEEVLKYALEHHPRHGPAVEEITGYTIPWLLNDRDPQTLFDQRIRRKAGSAIKAFESQLTELGQGQGSDRHDELLAVALYAFALSPAKQATPRLKIPVGVEKELRSAGLETVMEYLGQNGGLGRIDVKEDCALEASALQALENKCGRCSEHSKILYALFIMAGIDAEFVFGKVEYAAMEELELGPGFLHFAVGLELGDRIRYFDLANRSSDAGFLYRRNLDWWFAITDREALALHHAGLCIRYVKLSRPKPALEECEKALQLDATSFVAFMNLGAAQEERGRPDLAAANYRRALRIHPDYAEAYYDLGRIAYGKGEVDRAVELFDTAIRLHPGFTQARNILQVIRQRPER